MTKTKSTFLALIAVLLSPMAVNADVIEITGAADASNNGLWDVTTIFGQYSDIAGMLRSQIWWEDSDLAQLFAITVADTFGFPNLGGRRGPAFNVTETGSVLNIAGFPVQGWRFNTAGSITGYVHSTGSTQTWAVAARVSVPEPGTLALLGIGLFGMGLARRRKKV